MKSAFIGVFLLLCSLSVFAQDLRLAKKKVNEDTDFIITASVNYGFRLKELGSGLSDTEKTYYRKLKSGISYDFAAYYRINELAAIGAKYNVFKSGASVDNIVYEAPNGDITNSVSEDITISFYGVGFIIDELEPETRHELTLEMGLGYMHYMDDANIAGRYELRGGNLAIYGNAAYRYRIFENFSVGPQFGFFGSSLKKLKTEGPDGYSETTRYRSRSSQNNLWRFDAGISAIYRF